MLSAESVRICFVRRMRYRAQHFLQKQAAQVTGNSTIWCHFYFERDVDMGTRALVENALGVVPLNISSKHALHKKIVFAKSAAY